jgi:heme oxygenase
MLIQSPCKDCAKRTLTCHHEGECEDWRKFREKIDQAKATERAESDFVGARVDSLERIRRKKNAKNRV